MRLLFIGAAMLAISTGAQAADQFDLKCSGTRQTKVDGPAEPYTFGFRIDLQAKVWCWERCDRTSSIVEVTPDRIVTNRSKTLNFRKDDSLDAEINRATGRFQSLWIQTRPFPTYYKVEGQCEPAPFSGFPSTKF